MVIGATIVSLGTTLPELSASTISALQGNSGFALGNAVGSLITNTSLVLGVAALFGLIPVGRKESQKMTILVGAIILMVVPSLVTFAKTGQGNIPQGLGLLMVALVPVYMVFIILQEKKNPSLDDELGRKEVQSSQKVFLLSLFVIVAALVIAGSASLLVSSSEILAVRIGVPDSVVASTLVAFGTSVPELSTAIAATKSGHGGLALGNVLGANILNILFVVGISVVLTQGGIMVSKEFLLIHYVVMVIVTGIFGFFAYNNKVNKLSRGEGRLLICVYCVYLVANLLYK